MSPIIVPVGQFIALPGPVVENRHAVQGGAGCSRCEALETRVLLLEEMLKPTKVQADSWSIAVGQ